MYTLYKFHFLNGISEINQLFDDILIIWPAPVYVYIYIIFTFSHVADAFIWLTNDGNKSNQNQKNINNMQVLRQDSVSLTQYT